ncbi:MAG: UDP-N-acetylglucosamine 2-epimerase (non-hydrolyzing) [Christensenellaceae bacterium]
MRRVKVLSVFGTRPEAIKMCPLVLELQSHPEIDSLVCVTAQHRQMLDQVLEIFQIKPDYDLNLMKDKQTLFSITSGILDQMETVLESAKPDLVLVHGDTSTTFAVALAAFYKKIPVGHVEAGLRTYDKYSPFPEEMNRLLTSRIAELHFAPTKNNEANLANEGISKQVYITGNTVIDAFKTTVKKNYSYKSPELAALDLSKWRTVLLTAHRRENLGEPLENICRAVRHLADTHEDLSFVYPMHLNPVVRDTAVAVLGGHPRIHLIEPLDVEDMHNLMSKCYMVMTDSGGLQEEAPSLGVPVVVLRTETERPEAVDAGTVIVAGVDEDNIFTVSDKLITDSITYKQMANAVNPYGDGHASQKITDYIIEWFKGYTDIERLYFD